MQPALMAFQELGQSQYAGDYLQGIRVTDLILILPLFDEGIDIIRCCRVCHWRTLGLDYEPSLIFYLYINNLHVKINLQRKAFLENKEKQIIYKRGKQTGRNLFDVSFAVEDSFIMDNIARARKVHAD